MEVETLNELLERCRHSPTDEGAWSRLFARFQRFALSQAGSVVDDRSAASDVVQEAFLTVFTRLSQLRSDDAFTGWFRQIIRSRARSIRALSRPSAELKDVAVDSPNASENAEEAEFVRAVLQALPPVQRETARLFYLDELSYAETARAVGVPLGSVKRRLHDARESLRRQLSGRVGSQMGQRRPPL